VACEFSGIVRDAFRERGHDAWSCDLLPTESDPSWHLVGNAMAYLNEKWDLLIAHPPCTFLTNAGAPLMNDPARVEGMYDGAQFFNYLKNSDISRICIENPIPHGRAREPIGNYTQKIQPWQFGHEETKPICLWLKNLPLLRPTIIVPMSKNMTKLERQRIQFRNYLPPTADRGLIRSRFFRGVALAMANQWGSSCA
jgi:hypothetical protein